MSRMKDKLLLKLCTCNSFNVKYGNSNTHTGYRPPYLELQEDKQVCS